MTTPEEGRRSDLDGLRQYLRALIDRLPVSREQLRPLIANLPIFWRRLQGLAGEMARKFEDDGGVKRETHLQRANEGLKAYMPTRAASTTSTDAGLPPHRDVAGVPDEQLIGNLIRQWMERDPAGASRGLVEAVGLGGAHRLPEDDRLKLARAFLAMLDVDPRAFRYRGSEQPHDRPRTRSIGRAQPVPGDSTSYAGRSAPANGGAAAVARGAGAAELGGG